MNTGLENLDNIFNIEQPQLVILTGNPIVDMLSGDIANNICLNNDRYEVLEVVRCYKEYLIKRLFINQSEVNYRKWCLKDQYSDEELKQIGQATVNLIETTKRLPRIIENDLGSLNDLKKYIYEFANKYADRDEIMSLIVIDIYPLNNIYNKKKKGYYKYKRFMSAMSKYAKRYNCSILIICTNEIILDEVSKYADRIIRLNDMKDSIVDLDVIESDKVINNCKLKYNYEIRRFEDC